MVNIISDMIPRSASNRPGHWQTPNKIVVHETANASRGANAAMHGRYVKGADARRRSVSWHFTVDDKEIRQHLPINERGWHSGAGNINSVGIEICVNSDGNWQKTKANAQALIAHLQALGISVITTHRQETGKNCPARLLREGFASFLAGVGAVEQVKSETTEDEEEYVVLDADFLSIIKRLRTLCGALALVIWRIS